MRRTATILTLLAALLTAAAAYAAEKGLVARYTFDEGGGDVVRDSSGNGNDGRVHNAVFVKSPRGFALQFDDQKQSYVDCGSKPVLNIAGDMTMEAWIKVDPTDKGDKFIYGDNASLAVDRNFHFASVNGRLKLEHGNRTACEQIATDKEIFDGTWQHLACVVEYPDYRVYVNGREVWHTTMMMPILPTPITNFCIGGWFYEKGFLRGEIDELSVYNVALSERAIAEHAGIGAAELRTEIQSLQSSLHYPKQRVDARLLCRNIVAGETTAELLLTGKSGAKISRLTGAVKETRPGSQRGAAEFQLDAAKLTPGEYTLRALLRDKAGKEAGSAAETSFTWPEKPEWFGSKAGISDKVLPPYSDLRVEKQGGRVAVLTCGRKYEFGDAPFALALESKGQALLAAPVRLTGTVNGRALALTGKPAKVQESSATQAILAQKLTDKGISVSIRTVVEFDGLMRMDWQVAAAKATAIDNLTVEIPLDAARAQYIYHWNSSGCVRGAGALKEAERNFAFEPILWLGDDERGLSWFAESDQYWYPADDSKAIQVVKGLKEVTLRLNLIGKKVQLEPGAPLKYSFGLQATPVKPIGQTCWDYRFYDLSQEDIKYPSDAMMVVPDSLLDTLAAGGVKTIQVSSQWEPLQNYPKTPYGEKVRSLVARSHQRGMKVILYLGFNISDLIPEWPYIGDDCATSPKGGYTPLTNLYQPVQNAYNVCLKSVYQDLMADGVARMMEDFDIDGVYLDTTSSPWACSNALHGCGYVRPDGSRAPTYPVFAVRETIKRIYTAVKQRKPDGLVDLHVYDCMNSPALSYVTSYWTGEQLSPAKFYPDGLPLDRFRTEFMGVNWGVPAELLYYHLGPYENGFSLALLHDVDVRPEATWNLPFASGVWKAMLDFDRANALWYPYWKNSRYVTVQPANCFASLYRHPRNGLMIALSNLSPEKASIVLELDRAALGLTGPLSARDAVTGKEIAVQENTVTTELPSVGWQLIRVEAQPPR